MNLEDCLRLVKEFHEKHDFPVGTADNDKMAYRQNLLMEEVGEISECLTKGRSEENLREEIADVFIVILGHVVARGIDLEKAFVEKMKEIISRPPK